MSRHILRAGDFTWPVLEVLFKRAAWFKNVFINHEGGRDKIRRMYPRYLMLYTFAEASTRTRISSAVAGAHLGMSVQGTDNAQEFSSKKKGESWADMGRVMSGYQTDIMVARTRLAGEVAEIASGSLCSVINAGDGLGEHPTQALLDLFTIWEEFGTLEELHLAVGGDLARGRTVNSLVRMMTMFSGVEFSFFSPKELKINDELRAHLETKGVKYTEYTGISPELFADPRVFYWTRAQDERLGGHIAEPLVIDVEQVKWMHPDSILMHPLPVGFGNEITEAVRAHARIPRGLREALFRLAQFFEQSDNGLWIRMACIEYCLGTLPGLLEAEALVSVGGAL